MTFLIFLILSLVAFLALQGPIKRSRLGKLSPPQQSLIALGVVLLLFLLFTGRLGFIIPLLGAVLAALVATVSRILPLLAPLINQHLPNVLERWRQGRVEPWPEHQDAGSSKSRSTVESAFLRMHLDTGRGILSGEILAGKHAGQPLERLTLEDLAALHATYRRQDETSAQLLGAYLERHFGHDWANTVRRGKHRTSEIKMTRSDALEILGLSPEADREAIIKAHRRLIQKLHPDRGGSDYLAAKINQAKDFLLEA